MCEFYFITLIEYMLEEKSVRLYQFAFVELLQKAWQDNI